MSFKLKQVVRHWPEISQPPPATPEPMMGKVVGVPTRTPVNRQAAFLLSKSSWVNQPPPEPAETVTTIRAKLKEVELELCRVKEERRLWKLSEAKLVAKLKDEQAKSAAAWGKLDKLQKLIDGLEARIRNTAKL